MGNVLRMTPKQMSEWTIAQKDDEDYQESGYIALKISDEECYLSNYSHCSCYGTFTCLAGGGISEYYEQDQVAELQFIWKGTWQELVAMAKRKADPHVPTLTAREADYDYTHLMDVYGQILSLAGEEADDHG